MVVTEASITGRFRKVKRRTYKDQSSSSLLSKLLKGPSSFMLVAYVIFELRSDQTRRVSISAHPALHTCVPRIRRCRRSPLLSTSLVIVCRALLKWHSPLGPWPPHSPAPVMVFGCKRLPSNMLLSLGYLFP